MFQAYFRLCYFVLGFVDLELSTKTIRLVSIQDYIRKFGEVQEIEELWPVCPTKSSCPNGSTNLPKSAFAGKMPKLKDTGGSDPSKV